MYPQQRGRQVYQQRLRCRHCGDTLEARDDSPDMIYCSCGRVGLGGDPMSPTIQGEVQDIEDLSRVRSFQVR